MDLLKVDTLEEARNHLLDFIEKIPRKTEKIPILQAGYCTVAQDVIAPENIPPFCRSAVDGYAVVASNTYGACDSIPVFLDLVEEVAMGDSTSTVLKEGQCVYVPTGGMIPSGADAMVMVEYCESFDAQTIAVYQPVAVGKDVIYPGDDMKEGECIIRSGTVLRPQEIAALATLGIAEIEVYKPYTGIIISTGDELVDVNSKPEKGQIRESNSYSIQLQAEHAKMQILERKKLPDDEDILKQQIQEAMQISDFVLVSGGSSQGKKDMTSSIFNQLTHGGVCTHGLALKPGKPTILAWDEDTHTILVGLPGHPTAASMVFELLIAWVLDFVRGNALKPSIKALMQVNLASAPGRMTCVPVRLIPKDSFVEAIPVLGRSGHWSTLFQSDGYVLLDRNQEGIKAGDLVEVFLFERA